MAHIIKRKSHQIKWHNIDKSIYDEKLDRTIVFKLFGISLFKHSTDVEILHDVNTSKKIKPPGFVTDDN